MNFTGKLLVSSHNQHSIFLYLKLTNDSVHLKYAHSLTEKNKEQILGKATKSSDRVRREIARRIASEITTENYYRFHRAFTPGLQEYIEARTFLSYCSSGTVIPRDDIQRELIETCDEEKVTGSLHINASDYLLGIADLTGELMRMALGGQTGDAVLIRAAMAEIEHAMAELSGSHRIARDMPSKMNVLRQSVVKVERACFDKAVRAAEMPGGSKGRSVKRGITDVDDTVRVQVAKKPKQEA